MNIFFTNFHHGWGGQPFQALQLAVAMQKRGHNVRVFSPPESDLATRAAEAGLDVQTCCLFRRGFRPLCQAKDILRLRKQIKEFETDIIHCHGSQDTWLVATTLISRSCRTKLIRTKHNSYPASRHAANRWLYNKAIAKTIAVAGPIRDELLEGGFVAPEKVCVIHAGLDDGFAASRKRSREKIRKELGISADALVVGLVGRLAPDKGQDTLLEAAPKVLEKFPKARFVLVGTGGDWDRIRGIIEEKKLQDSIIWAGFRTDVADITASFDVSLLAARACDASSTVIKEAMSLRVPVVATDVGGTAEIIEDGACGLLVVPGDAVDLARGILETFSDHDATAARVEKAYSRAQDFLSSNIAEATEQVYLEALK